MEAELAFPHQTEMSVEMQASWLQRLCPHLVGGRGGSHLSSHFPLLDPSVAHHAAAAALAPPVEKPQAWGQRTLSKGKEGIKPRLSPDFRKHLNQMDTCLRVHLSIPVFICGIGAANRVNQEISSCPQLPQNQAAGEATSLALGTQAVMVFLVNTSTSNSLQTPEPPGPGTRLLLSVLLSALQRVHLQPVGWRRGPVPGGKGCICLAKHS